MSSLTSAGSPSSACLALSDSAPRRFLLFGIESDEPSDVEVMPFDLQCLIIQYFIVPDESYPESALEIRGTNRAEQRRELIALATSSSAVAALFQGIEHKYFDAFTEEFGGWILATIPIILVASTSCSDRHEPHEAAAPAAAPVAAPAASPSGSSAAAGAGSAALTVTCSRVIEDLSALHAETLSSLWCAATPSWAKKGERFTVSGRLLSVCAFLMVPAQHNPHRRVSSVIEIEFEAAHSFSYENCITTLNCIDVAGAPHAIMFGDRSSKVAQHELRFSIADFQINKIEE